MGRFMSPDPVFISAQRLADPQSLNLYAYVRNNPLGLTVDRRYRARLLSGLRDFRPLRMRASSERQLFGVGTGAERQWFVPNC